MALNHDDKYTELIEKYDKIRNELNSQYDTEMSSGKISEKQSKNFVEYEKIQEMIFDKQDDSDLGEVRIEPYLDHPVKWEQP